MDDLFATQESAASAARREAINRHSWAMWGWTGPAEGGLCDIDIPIVATPDGACLYCYAEQARLIERQPDGRWLAEIEMGEVRGKPWFKDGRQVLLDPDHMRPPRRVIRAARNAA